MAINRPNDRFSNRALRLQASTPPAIEHLSFASPDFLHRERCGAFQSGASDDRTANHDERCPLASRAKFDIGVRSSKDGKSGAWWRTLAPSGGLVPARQRGKMLKSIT